MTADGGAYCLKNPRPLRFSGATGVIATFLREAQPPAGEPWTLPETPGFWRVFSQAERNGELRLSRVMRIRGVSDRQTELLFTLSPLTLKSGDAAAAEWHVAAPSDAREWSEQLALDAGLSDMSGQWKWCDRPLNIGAAVLG